MTSDKMYCKYPYDGFIGYVHRNSENRNIVIMTKYVGNVKILKSVSLAKYLVETTMKNFIPKGFEVDHINNIKTDDKIENLQVIPKWLNIVKQTYDNNDFELTVIKCPVCDKISYKNRQDMTNSMCLRKKKAPSRYITCGSKHCTGIVSTAFPKLVFGDPYRLDKDGLDIYNNILGKTLDINRILYLESILDRNNVKYIKRFR